MVAHWVHYRMEHQTLPDTKMDPVATAYPPKLKAKDNNTVVTIV